MGPKKDKLPVDCFICSEDVVRVPRYIAKQVTKFTQTPFTQVLSQVLDDEFYVVAAETDVVCKKCCELINLRDKTSKVLADTLKQKYKLRDGNEEVEQLIDQLVTSPKTEIDSQNSFCGEGVEDPPEESSIEPGIGKSNIKKPDGIEILASICESQLLQEHKTDTLTTLVKFLCRFCEFSGSSSKLVLDHIEEKHSEIMSCDLCSCKFRTKAEITDHMISVHNFDGNAVTCSSCKAQFCNFKSFEDHKTPFIKGVQHYCKVCDSEFSSVKAYTNHCTQMHSDEDKNSFDDDIKVLYICKCCHQKFLDYSEFGNHCKIHESLIVSKDDQDQSGTTPTESPKKIFVIFQQGTTPDLPTKKVDQNSPKKVKNAKRKRMPPPVLSLSLISHSKTTETSSESRKVFECGICSIRMNSSDDLKDHFKTHSTFNLPCKDCNLPFYSLSEYKLHQNYHWKEGMIATCESCETVFKQKCDMIDHIKTIHKWTLACEFCGQQFYSKSKLVVHVKRHPESKSFVCSICETRFRTLKCLTQHMDDIHTTPTCVHCSKTFTTLAALKKHECPLNETRALLKCSFCSKQFKSRSGKRDHELTHTGQHKYKCEECKKNFITKRVYNEHMNALHSDSPKTLYTCELCGSKFLHLHSYAAHKKAHGKFSYICEHCGKEITQPNYIKIHLRTHTGDRPFQCPYCEKRFNNGSYMRRHIMFHTKQFAYECEDCGKGFPSRKPYLMHREKEHNDMSYTESCDVCLSLVEGNDKSAAYVMHRHKVHGQPLPRKVATVKLGRKFDYNFSAKDEDEDVMAVETITTDIIPDTYMDNIEGTVSQTIEIVTIETI